MKLFILGLLAVVLSGCFEDDRQTQLGKVLFDENCAFCHGKEAKGSGVGWRKYQRDGGFPPPPLDGSEYPTHSPYAWFSARHNFQGYKHAWHYAPRSVLKTIDDGKSGEKLSVEMPSFKDELIPNEKQAILDYLYSLWPDEMQRRYDVKFK